jgi:WD40 repeat protein
MGDNHDNHDNHDNGDSSNNNNNNNDNNNTSYCYLPTSILATNVLVYLERSSWNNLSVTSQELWDETRRGDGGGGGGGETPPWPDQNPYVQLPVDMVYSFAFSPHDGGRYLACGTFEGQILVWDNVTGQCDTLQTMEEDDDDNNVSGTRADVRCLVFPVSSSYSSSYSSSSIPHTNNNTRNSHRLVWVAVDGSIRQWDDIRGGKYYQHHDHDGELQQQPQRRRPTCRLLGRIGMTLQESDKVSLSADGTILAVGRALNRRTRTPPTVSIWNLADNRNNNSHSKNNHNENKNSHKKAEEENSNGGVSVYDDDDVGNDDDYDYSCWNHWIVNLPECYFVHALELSSGGPLNTMTTTTAAAGGGGGGGGSDGRYLAAVFGHWVCLWNFDQSDFPKPPLKTTTKKQQPRIRMDPPPPPHGSNNTTTTTTNSNTPPPPNRGPTSVLPKHPHPIRAIAWSSCSSYNNLIETIVNNNNHNNNPSPIPNNNNNNNYSTNSNNSKNNNNNLTTSNRRLLVLLACGLEDGTIWIWSIPNVACLYKLDANSLMTTTPLPPSAIYSLAFTPNHNHYHHNNHNHNPHYHHDDDDDYHGSTASHAPYSTATTNDTPLYLASGNETGMIRLWNVTTGTCLSTNGPAVHTDRIWAMTVTPNGQTVASYGSDGTIRLQTIPPRNVGGDSAGGGGVDG